MGKKQPLKSGEKILFIIFGIFFLLAVIAYIGLETYRMNSEKPMFQQLTHFDFSEAGKVGSELYRKNRCNSCHRALRTGTSMGLSLDGIGSKRTVEWIESFLLKPEEVYGSPTLDHGLPPKEAAYVSDIPAEDRKVIAIFLSELRADAGSSVAKVPPPERSEFIDNMVKMWAPEDWQGKYEDIRDKPSSDKE
ncbi:MAG: cytochrome c [Gammaproteobacteria bacterium]|nr:cytochrome c [Gammaproteobacteria bacterium]